MNVTPTICPALLRRPNLVRLSRPVIAKGAARLRAQFCHRAQVPTRRGRSGLFGERRKSERKWQAEGAEKAGPGSAQVLVTLEVDAVDADAGGYEPVWSEDRKVGFVTSGGYGYTVGKSLAMALVDRDVAGEGSLHRVLREFRRREMVRVIWRDIAEQAPLAETLSDLSEMADVCIVQALDRLHEWTCAELGVPRDRQGREAWLAARRYVGAVRSVSQFRLWERLFALFERNLNRAT